MAPSLAGEHDPLELLTIDDSHMGVNDVFVGGEDEEEDGLTESSKTLSSSDIDTWYLIVLTISLGGLQVAFSVQFAEGTNYLHSLGFSAIETSSIWLIPPLSGAILQPTLGLLSDITATTWGRRKPFIAAGAFGVSISLLALAWTPEMASMLIPATQSAAYIKVIAVSAMIGLNLSAQAMQVAARSLIVEQCPIHHQSQANAWAGRMISIANILSYFLSSIEPSSRAVQPVLKRLSVFGGFLVTVAAGVTCLGISEFQTSTVGGTILPSRIWKHARASVAGARGTRFSEMMAIQSIQSASWFAWFPFLTYITNYVQDIYIEELRMKHKENRLYEQSLNGNGYGSQVLLWHALVALVASTVIPGAIDTFQIAPKSPVSGARIRYRTVWAMSQLLCSLCLFGIMQAQSTLVVLSLSGMLGVSWAITQWIPSMLINMEILRSGVEEQGTRSCTGTLIGLNNVSIAAPQILSTLWNTLIFELVDYKLALAFVLGSSASVSLLAALLCFRLRYW